MCLPPNTPRLSWNQSRLSGWPCASPVRRTQLNFGSFFRTERAPCPKYRIQVRMYPTANYFFFQIPEMRFDTASVPAYLDSSTVSRMGNFLANPGAFDHKFFNISPRAAEAMDPQQRILLHVAHEALEDAGYVPDSTRSWEREGFGCFVGAATAEWADCLREQVDLYHSTGIYLPSVCYGGPPNCAPGTLRAFLSGRISHFMKWGGPSIVVDTACSSSIVAIYQACRALQNGDCNAALAGGVNIICSPDVRWF